MPFDSIHTPAPDGLAARAAAASSRPEGKAEGTKNPRSVTRGSFSRITRKSKRKSDQDERIEALLGHFVFDWFQITLPSSAGGGMISEDGDEARSINEAYEWSERMGLHLGKVSGGSNGYRAGMPLHDGPEGEAVAKIMCGSVGGVMPNLTITGGEGVCANLAPAAQAAFSGARLSRADVRFDWSQKGLWDGLLSMTRRLASTNAKMGGVRVIESDTGRTFYLGSPTSTVRLRVYEKDKERVASGKLDAAECDPDLVRVEFVFRPQSRSKEGFAKLTPAEMLRSSVWAREWLVRMAQMMGVVDWAVKLPKTHVDREPRLSSLEESAAHGVKQFGGVFSRLAISRMVSETYDGCYADAVLTSDEVEAKAAMLFWQFLKESELAKRVMDREGVVTPETVRARRRRSVSNLLASADDHAAKTAAARELIEECCC